MYTYSKAKKTTIKRNKSYEGETIENKVARIVNNKEPIKDGAPRVYTERKEGVLPAYNIRTDRFDVAVDAMDKVTKTYQAQREERHKAKVIDMNKDNELKQNNDGGAEPTQGK